MPGVPGDHAESGGWLDRDLARYYAARVADVDGAEITPGQVDVTAGQEDRVQFVGIGTRGPVYSGEFDPEPDDLRPVIAVDEADVQGARIVNDPNKVEVHVRPTPHLPVRIILGE